MAKGKKLGLQGTLEALKGTAGGDTQALAKMFSSTEAQNAILGLAGAQTKDFTNKTQAMYDATGATDSTFAEQTDKLGNTIQAYSSIKKSRGRVHGYA